MKIKQWIDILIVYNLLSPYNLHCYKTQIWYLTLTNCIEVTLLYRSIYGQQLFKTCICIARYFLSVHTLRCGKPWIAIIEKKITGQLYDCFGALFLRYYSKWGLMFISRQFRVIYFFVSHFHMIHTSCMYWLSFEIVSIVC